MGVIGFNGGIVGPDNTPTTSVASGVWTLDELFAARDLDIWPSVVLAALSVEYLVIAGGGAGANGGGGFAGGAGGAGGYRNSTGSETSGGLSPTETPLVLSPATPFSVSVGAGGASPPLASNGGNGSNSSFDTITSIGGGGGGSGGTGASFVGSAGGSGGGGGCRQGTPGTGGVGGVGTPSQGFAGGKARNHASNDNNLQSGGGGGSSQIGGDGLVSVGGKGGDGLASSVTGTSVSRAGGGGGGSFMQTVGSGGSGGGGNGGRLFSPLVSAQSGTVNSGGGGGGTAVNVDFTAGAGGSGVVVIRYPNTFQNLLIGAGLQYRDSGGSTVTGTGVRVAPSYSPSGFKVYEFRGGTGNIEF